MISMRFSRFVSCFHSVINKAKNLRLTADLPPLPLQASISTLTHENSLPPPPPPPQPPAGSSLPEQNVTTSPPPSFHRLSLFPPQTTISPTNSSFLAPLPSNLRSMPHHPKNLRRNTSLPAPPPRSLWSNSPPPTNLQINSPAPPPRNSLFTVPENIQNNSSPPGNLQSNSPAPAPSTAANGGINGSQWVFLVMGACMTGASATLQVIQSKTPLSTASKSVYVAMAISIVVFVAAVFLRANYPRAADRAVQLGSISAVATFLAALATAITRHE